MKKTRARSALLLAAATVAITAISACTSVLGGFQLVCEQPCKQPTDCPDPMNACVQRTCNAGCCDTEDVPAMTSVTMQPAGTCQRLVCDGDGKTQTVTDDTNTPAASDDCHKGGCIAGMPTQVPAAEGTKCSSNGGRVCAGGAAPGTCVACNAGEDCPTTMPSCVSSMCFPSTCTDMVKDDLETDVDCGGGSCPPCADGKACLKPADCSSLVCSGSKCQTATCTDMVKNGTETDVDCGGGGMCPTCAFGLGCKVDTDCLSGFCVSGHCGGQMIATGQEAPQGIAVDTSTLANLHSVYWTSVNSGSVHRVLANGTGGVVIVKSGLTSPTSIAIATLGVGSYVVWTDSPPSAEGSVMQASIGLAPLGPAEIAAQQLSVGLIVADDTNAYWVAGGNLVQAPVGPSDAGTSGTVRGPVVGAAGIAVDSTADIYWTSSTAGTVNGFYAGLSASKPFITGQQTPTAIAVDDTNVYWCNTVASGTVMQQERTKAPAPLAIAMGQDLPTNIALSTSDVYWSTSAAGDNRLLKVPIGGGAQTVLVSGASAITAIAVDSGYVYWANSFDSTINRVVR